MFILDFEEWSLDASLSCWKVVVSFVCWKCSYLDKFSHPINVYQALLNSDNVTFLIGCSRYLLVSPNMKKTFFVNRKRNLHMCQKWCFFLIKFATEWKRINATAFLWNTHRKLNCYRSAWCQLLSKPCTTLGLQASFFQTLQTTSVYCCKVVKQHRKLLCHQLSC